MKFIKLIFIVIFFTNSCAISNLSHIEKKEIRKIYLYLIPFRFESHHYFTPEEIISKCKVKAILEDSEYYNFKMLNKHIQSLSENGNDKCNDFRLLALIKYTNKGYLKIYITKCGDYMIDSKYYKGDNYILKTLMTPFSGNFYYDVDQFK
jgi:hypothetical protein